MLLRKSKKEKIHLYNCMVLIQIKDLCVSGPPLFKLVLFRGRPFIEIIWEDRGGTAEREMVDGCGRRGRRTHSEPMPARGGRACSRRRTPQTFEPFNSVERTLPKVEVLLTRNET